MGWALLAAGTLDGVPENLALGVSLVEGASISLLVAIFASNLPESLVGSMATRREGRGAAVVMGTWVACAVVLALAVVLGRAVADALGDSVLAVALAFAGGAVLASLADTLAGGVRAWTPAERLRQRCGVLPVIRARGLDRPLARPA